MTITLYPGEIKQVNVALTPTPGGALEATKIPLLDKTDSKWIDPGVVFPYNHLGHVVVYVTNNSDVEVFIDLHTWWQSPSGKHLGEDTYPFYNKSMTAGVPPHTKAGVGTIDVILNEVGTWHYIANIEFVPGTPTVPSVNGDRVIEVA